MGGESSGFNNQSLTGALSIRQPDPGDRRMIPILLQDLRFADLAWPGVPP